MHFPCTGGLGLARRCCPLPLAGGVRGGPVPPHRPTPGPSRKREGDLRAMTDWPPYAARAREWFESLRDRICAEFEAIEREAGSDAAFEYIEWRREEEGNPNPGGGVRGVMKGQVFEKVGVNVSTVAGQFSPEFAATMHGAEDNPGFTATGISL